MFVRHERVAVMNGVQCRRVESVLYGKFMVVL